MGSPIEGEQYLRTLAHYIHTNEFRFTAPSSRQSRSGPYQPGPLSGAGNYLNERSVAVGNVLGETIGVMASSIFNVAEALSTTSPPPRRNSTGFSGFERQPSLGSTPPLAHSTSIVSTSAASPSIITFSSTQPKVIPLTLDPLHLYFLLVQFESLGLDIGDPALLGSIPANSVVGSDSSARDSLRDRRTKSVHSASSLGSNLSLSRGWNLWPNGTTGPSGNHQPSLQEDIIYIYKTFSRIIGLRLQQNVTSTVASGGTTGSRVIIGYENVVFPCPDGSIVLSTTPFRYLTHLELKDFHPRVVDGWQTLQSRLVVLIVRVAGVDDVGEVVIDIVVDGLRRRNRIPNEPKNSQAGDAVSDEGISLTTSSPAKPVYDLNALLAPQIPWSGLKHFSLAENCLVELSSYPCSYLIGLTHLDLSHNLLENVPAALSSLYNLQTLNLAYNMIKKITGINTVLGNVQQLDMRGNKIISLCGLERLWALEKVDLRDNKIEEWKEVRRLAGLPALKEVWVEGNPLCVLQPNYRIDLFSSFRSNELDVLLDGYGPSFTERRQIHVTPRAESFDGKLAAVVTAPILKPSASSPVRSFVPSPTTSPNLGPIEGHTVRQAKSGRKKAKRLVALDEDVPREDVPREWEGRRMSLPAPVTQPVDSEVAAAKRLIEATQKAAAAITTAHTTTTTPATTFAPVSPMLPSAYDASLPPRPPSPLTVSPSTSSSRRPVHRLQELEQSVAAAPTPDVPASSTGRRHRGQPHKASTMHSHSQHHVASPHHHRSGRPPIPKGQHHNGHRHSNSLGSVSAALAMGDAVVPETVGVASASSIKSSKSDESIKSDGSNGAKGEPLDQTQQGDKYRKKLEAMRNEAGSGWLRVLEELK